ncbi:ABC transporter ATP-binding protein [Paracoccus alkenifer]|uniref:Amino acid/amide ABC transporter ATP-binding protein 2, HAAT family n=1 Tax=Paracoccus alkenifer TaxID=65735 RepID=A0A1H6LVW6_9RHOB|nr:ABC transporter ATP-binding protein [Paracoccus alkenifer]SEH89668.1 amino acid/amide ABC transporter ATP-binding protein 2, HAAT family [Paracoccus alkenifer]
MLLEVKNLRVDYHKVPAVRGLNIEIAQGEVVCMVGPNGAGKSTTAMTIAGVKRLTSGQILLDGVDISRTTPEAVAAMGVSLVPEGRRIFGRMSVRENLLIGAPLARKRGQQAQSLDRMYELFPILEQRRDQPAGQMSGGEQQQLAIARAMMTGPRLLIVDEPSLGLAPQFVDLVFSTFVRLRQEGVTILVVEQSSRRALALADRLYLVRSGGVVMEGPVDELTSNAGFEAAYFGEVGTR